VSRILTDESVGRWMDRRKGRTYRHRLFSFVLLDYFLTIVYYYSFTDPLGDLHTSVGPTRAAVVVRGRLLFWGGDVCGGVAWPPLQEHLILGAIVLPVPNPSCILVVLDIILSNQAFYRRFYSAGRSYCSVFWVFVFIPAMYPLQSLR
jgi:hypothetical protein